jgi:hypothetical protein
MNLSVNVLFSILGQINVQVYIEINAFLLFGGEVCNSRFNALFPDE